MARLITRGGAGAAGPPGPAGSGAATPANFTIGTIGFQWQAARPKHSATTLVLTIPVTPPGTVPDGGHLYLEFPDQSSAPSLRMDGTTPMDGTHEMHGAWSPIDLGKIPYAADQQPWTVEFEPTVEVNVSTAIRVYVASYTGQVDNPLVQAGLSGATPSGLVTVTPYAQAKPGSGSNVTPLLVTAISASVGTAVSVGGKLKRPISVTVDLTGLGTQPLPSDWAYQLVGYVDGDLTGSPILASGYFTSDGLVPAGPDGIDAPHTFGPEEPIGDVSIMIYAVAGLMGYKRGALGDVPATFQPNNIIPGITASTVVAIGTASGTLDGGAMQAATITGAAIASATITGTLIASATITGANIGLATITGGNIGSATITGANIGSATITGGNISSATITGANIAAATIAGANITAATITGTQIGSATITGANIASATITGSNIAASTVAGSNISASTVTGANIAASTVSGANIASATVTGANIDNLTISAANIVNLTIDGTKVAASTLTGGNIASNTITGSNLVNQTITATQLANATITATQIANATITGSNIATATITGSNLVNATITGTQIASATITAANITSATITGTQIASVTITGSNIAGLTITGGNIAAAANTAFHIASATITATQIANLTITATQIANLTITGSQIANATITNAKITDLDVSKLNAGTISVAVALTSPTITVTGSGFTVNIDSTWAVRVNDGSTYMTRMLPGTVGIYNGLSLFSPLISALSHSGSEGFLQLSSSGSVKAELSAVGGSGQLIMNSQQVVGARQTGPGVPSFATLADAQTWCSNLYAAIRASGGHGLVN